MGRVMVRIFIVTILDFYRQSFEFHFINLRSLPQFVLIHHVKRIYESPVNPLTPNVT